MEQKYKLMITIVDESGSKQFVVTKVMQKFIIYGLIILLCAVIAGYFIMIYFIKQLDDMEIAKQATFSQYQLIYEQNLSLEDDIKNKLQELQLIKGKIDELENMINIHSAYDTNGNSQNFNLHKLADAHKDLILQIIPNGNPLEIFQIKQKIKNKSRDKQFMNIAYSPLNSSVNMGYNYYTNKSQPVYATADGIVEFIRDDNQKYGYGNLVRISHALGFSTAYTNLHKVSVKQGDFISKGDVLGYTTPSLDIADLSKNQISLYYEVRFLGDELDTLAFTNWDKQNFEAIFESRENANIDLKSLMWTLNDIMRLNDMYSHFASNEFIQSNSDSIFSSDNMTSKNQYVSNMPYVSINANIKKSSSSNSRKTQNTHEAKIIKAKIIEAKTKENFVIQDISAIPNQHKQSLNKTDMFNSAVVSEQHTQQKSLPLQENWHSFVSQSYINLAYKHPLKAWL